MVATQIFLIFTPKILTSISFQMGWWFNHQPGFFFGGHALCTARTPDPTKEELFKDFLLGKDGCRIHVFCFWPTKTGTIRVPINQPVSQGGGIPMIYLLGQWLTGFKLLGIPYLVGKISRSNGFPSGSIG